MVNALFNQQSLVASDTIDSKNSLVSRNGNWLVTLQGDGNLCIYEAINGVKKAGGNCIWASRTHGRGVTKAVLNQNCTITFLNAQGGVVKTIGTPPAQMPTGGVVLIMQDDSNMCIYVPTFVYGSYQNPITDFGFLNSDRTTIAPKES